MRKSQKKLLLNNALMAVLAFAGLVLVAFGFGAFNKIVGMILVFVGLGSIK